MKKQERIKMKGIFRRPITFHELSISDPDDDTQTEKISSNPIDEIAIHSEREDGAHFFKCYIEGDDGNSYFVYQDDSANLAEGDRVSFEFIPKGEGQRIWAKNIKKLK